MPDLLIEVVENTGETVEWVPRARHFDTENDFKLDENNVDGELCKMGQQLLWYGDAFAELKAEAARKKEVTERISAALDARHRAALEKPTEGKIRSAVLNDENYLSARNAELASTANLIRVETWYKSLNKKIDCLQALAYKQRIELKHTGYNA